MAVYAYKAYSNEGSGASAGSVTADTPRHARDLLRERGLRVYALKPVEGAGGAGLRDQLRVASGAWVARLSRSRRQARVAGFVREMATLLGAGIAVVPALETIAKQQARTSPAQHTALLRLIDRVASGVALADAMREQPEVYDDLSVNIVAVGERSGALDQALTRLADYQTRSLQLKNKVVGALIYPCIVSAIAILVTLLLMTFVVPNILRPLVEAGKPLPWVTAVVKAASDGLLQWWWLLGLLAIGLACAFTAWVRTERGQWAWDRCLLRLPLLGDLIRKQSIVRVSTVLATLMRSGIVFLQAVKVTQGVTGNVVLRDALGRCATAVETGQDIADALEATDAFPPTVVQLFAVGQQTGQLENMLERLAADYDREVDVAAQRFTAALEPIMILMLAMLVGFIAFATILPILQAGEIM